jgi:hypothetical protein
LIVMTIDIVIRTWFRDFRWLALSLRSILRFVDGYRRIVVVMPESSFDRLPKGVVPDTKCITVATCAEFTNDYLGQQITKLHADEFTDASLIVHLDSDCIFEAKCDLRALLIRGDLITVRGAWSSRRQARDGWRQCVVDFYGRMLPFDAVVPPPLMFPASLYGELRSHCRSVHKVDIAQWVLARQIDTVSEYGLLAGEAWFRRPEEFFWSDIANEPLWPCRQYWSHTVRAAEIQRRLACELG